MAIQQQRLAGIAQLFVDGNSYLLEGDLTYNVSKVKRETLTGQDDVHGWAEKPHAPFISCNLRDSGSLTVADLNGMTGVTVVAQLANGKTIVGSGMWTIDAQDVSTEDAKISVRWEGGSVQEA